jgi:hypothetical protein
MREIILQQIKNRGGLYGYAAGLYSGDEALGDQLIVECFEQCHHEGAIRMWGAKLVADIIRYRLDLIRLPLIDVNRRLAGMAQSRIRLN